VLRLEVNGMNINKAIRELHEEKKRLDRVIASLEEMQLNPSRIAAVPEKKRGRKSMDHEARQEVSERMKRYWDARRKQEQTLEQSKA
jgi:hypothetical protein